MKKYIAISLITAYLFCTTELHQLLKLPVLIEHFVEHKVQNPEISFLGFLYIHYALADDHDGHHDRHMELPFKSHDNCLSSTICIGTSMAFESFSFDPISVFEKNIPIHSEAFFASAFLSNIWQPPQLS